MVLLEDISAALQKGKKDDVEKMVQQALDEGIEANNILNNGLMAGMDIIGAKFKNNEVYVPEVLIAARAMNAGMVVLKPHLASEDVGAKGTVVIGTVKNDLHDIGKNLVRMMMEGKGLTVLDLGSNVAADKFIDEAVANNADIICCSALLTTTMTEMKGVVKCAEDKGIRDKVKIMVGGAPITEDFCKSIGADIYSPDAASAAERAVEACA